MRRRFMNKSKGNFDYQKYMTIEVLEDDLEISVTRNVEYNKNGTTWKSLRAPFVLTGLKKGDLISFRCVLNQGETFGNFKSNGKPINLLGNSLSLIFGDNIQFDISSYPNVFRSTFSGVNMVIIGIDKAFLPATTLAAQCYFAMFDSCTSITTAPELPATILADRCYQDMFSYCTNLVNAPELPATILADNCYFRMFRGCTSLTTAPSILPAMTLADYCYNSMFKNCTSLTTAPELPATTLANNCYEYMFEDCTSLNYIKMLATDISATYCLHWWVPDVASTGTFVKATSMTSLPTGINGIPSGWTVVNA